MIEDDWLHQIAADRDNDGLRLMFADWLTLPRESHLQREKAKSGSLFAKPRRISCRSFGGWPSRKRRLSSA
jgi:hypothetical protein